MQTILGAGGVIGNETAKALKTHTKEIRLVSRNPKKIYEDDILFPADLTDPDQTDRAVAGSEIAYLTVGLPYTAKAWQAIWPVIMKNVIAACKKHHTKLVFFDNVYPYGKVKGPMTENTPYNPVSKKGTVRKQVAEMVMEAAEKGEINALIARAADFYGPATPLSFITAMVFENFAKGKKAQWMIRDDVKHALTYTPDAGKATALLGNTPEAYNQVWHLPTDPEALTGKEFIERAADAFGVSPKYTVLKKGVLRILGVFVPVIRESMEMLYQMEDDYIFYSSKFDRTFNFRTTRYEEGIKAAAKYYSDLLSESGN
jgi:nucleoside-diphosphate-sugar epimerase